jgi:RNA polymerase sigma factor (sigma-70 family)
LARNYGREKRDIKREQSLEQVLEQSAVNLAAWLADGDPSPSQNAQREESAVRVARALEALSDNQREAVVLRHFEGRSLTEISSALGCSTAGVAGLIYRGLKMMRRQLQEQE